MKLIGSQQMREFDRLTMDEYGVSVSALMDSAGRGVAAAVRRVLDLSPLPPATVRLIAGHGNNGGDAFVAARYLAAWGYSVDVWLAAQVSSLRGDAQTHFDRMLAQGIPAKEMPDARDWAALSATGSGGEYVLVDGLLGTGLRGPAHGTAAAAISYINTMGRLNPVVAIDLPSGLNADSGEVTGEAVRADLTVTMAFPKQGFIRPGAIDYVGCVEVVDIGVPTALEQRIAPGVELITVRDLLPLLTPRPRAAHKGVYGHVLIIGGAAGYAGAPAMAAAAAVRSGAGLVSVLVPAGIAAAVVATVPEAMVHPARETSAGTLAADCLASLPRKLNDFDAVAIGPGLTTHDAGRELVHTILDQVRIALLLDADALNVCAHQAAALAACTAPLMITPHPGEMARLLGCSTVDVQADRFAAASRAAELTRGIVVLKGAGTLVSAPREPTHVNLTGNPGMATGGTGDVLTGFIAGLLAQGLRPFDAARLGVFMHGHAADRAAWRAAQASLSARDVIAELPNVFREMWGR